MRQTKHFTLRMRILSSISRMLIFKMRIGSQSLGYLLLIVTMGTALLTAHYLFLIIYAVKIQYFIDKKVQLRLTKIKYDSFTASKRLKIQLRRKSTYLFSFYYICVLLNSRIYYMSIQNKKRKINIHSSLQLLISSFEDIKQYFSKNCQRQYYAELVLDLLREAIKFRSEAANPKIKQKHYHVSYIKHNRFLSPSQKQEVAQKVTQMIPVNQKPTKIYSKPKLTVYQNSPNYQHYLNEPNRQPSNQGSNHNNIQKQAIINEQAQNQEQLKKQDSSKYLSPKVQNRHQVTKNKNNGNNKEYISPPPKPVIKQYYSPNIKNSNTSNQQNRLKIQSNCKPAPNKIQNLVTSPRVRQNYDKIESKIKFLIERDKNNKRLQRQLEKQNHKIQQIEQRQSKLLLLQRQQQRQIERSQKINEYLNQSSSSSDDSESQSTNNRISKISQKVDIINQRVNGLHKYQNKIYSNLDVLADKTYKISTNPVYPISSSSSDEEIISNDY